MREDARIQLESFAAELRVASMAVAAVSRAGDATQIRQAILRAEDLVADALAYLDEEEHAKR